MPKDDSISSFAVLLTKLEYGALNDDLSAQFKDLSKTLTKHAEHFDKAKGELHLVLKLHADRTGTMSIDTDVKIKEPKVIRQRSHLWLTKGGTLSTTDPKQLELQGLREVPRPAEAPREVTADTDV